MSQSIHIPTVYISIKLPHILHQDQSLNPMAFTHVKPIISIPIPCEAPCETYHFHRQNCRPSFPGRVGDGIAGGLRFLPRQGLHVAVQDDAPRALRKHGGVDATHVGAVAETWG